MKRRPVSPPVVEDAEEDAAFLEGRPGPYALSEMRARGGEWAAYRNDALDSANRGHLQFLRVGEGATYAAPPAQYPVDNHHGLGWRYRYRGMVDLKTGTLRVGGDT